MNALRIWLLAAVVVLATTAAAEKIIHDGTYLHVVRTDVETPHVKWLKPSAGPTPKVLFLVARTWGASTRMRPRDIVEVWQRMELEYVEYLWMHSQSERDHWEKNVAGSTTEQKWAEATEKLAREYDAVVLIDFDTRWLPEEAQQVLRDKVQAGCGLVLSNGANWPWPLEAVPDSTRFLRGIPLTKIPAWAAQVGVPEGSGSSWEQVASRVGAAYRLGEGRVARIRTGVYGIDPEDEVHLEYGCSAYIRALQWVIPDLEPDITWKKLPEGELMSGRTQLLRRVLPGSPFVWQELPEGVAIPRAELPLKGLSISVHSSRSQAQSVFLDVAVRNHLNEVAYESTSKATLKPGDNSLAYGLPRLPAGPHFLDLWIRSAEGIEQYGSVGLTVTEPVRIATVVLDTPFHRLGDEYAEVTVALTAPLPRAAEVRVTATDTYGRRIADVTTPVSAGAANATVRLPLSLGLAMAQWIRAELHRDGEVLDVDQELLILGRSGPSEHPSIIWNGPEGGLHGLRQLRRQREAGFNISLSWVDDEGQIARFAALADMQLFTFATGVQSVSDGKEGKSTNPDFMREWKEKIIANVRETSRYTPYVYSLGDESHSGGPEQPLAPSDVEAFRAFLKGRYRDLAELNEVWGTSHASFDEIEPIPWDEPVSLANLPQKHERASFVEMLYAWTMHELDAALSELDPTARVGAEGSRPGDLELTLEGLEVWGPYSDRRVDVLLTSLAPKDLVQGMWWGGYHWENIPRRVQYDRHWKMVLEGVSNTSYFFDGLTGHHEGNTGTDLTFAAYFEENIPDFRKLLEGPGPLLAASDAYNNGVALLWSQASDHAGGFYNGRWQWEPNNLLPFPPPPNEMNGMFKPLDASGLNYRFVTDRQVVRDGLTTEQVKVLLLPMTTAVSKELAAALTTYVERGGMLLSVGTAGVMDEHCSVLEQGRLDDLLGIRRLGPPKGAQVDFAGTCDLVGARLQVEVQNVAADVSLRPAAAEALVWAGDVPLLLVNNVGEGAAVHLNGSFAVLASRGQPGSDAARALLDALLARAGAERLISFEPSNGTRAYAFTLGDVDLVSVIRLPDLSVPTAIRLASPRHVYDSMNPKYLGLTDLIQLPSEGRGFEIYCLADRELADPVVRVPATALKGEHLAVEAELPAGRDRLVRMDVYDPDGTWVRYYRRFETTDGDAAVFSVPFAQSDRTGAWTVRVTDVASGNAAETRIDLE